jgi:hypothetical protein
MRFPSIPLNSLIPPRLASLIFEGRFGSRFDILKLLPAFNAQSGVLRDIVYLS